MELQDRVAVVTGAARGIGKAIARRLFDAGATVIVADLDTEVRAGQSLGPILGRCPQVATGCVLAIHLELGPNRNSGSGSGFRLGWTASRYIGRLRFRVAYSHTEESDNTQTDGESQRPYAIILISMVDPVMPAMNSSKMSTSRAEAESLSG